jgi:uncharacterized protein DUF1493
MPGDTEANHGWVMPTFDEVATFVREQTSFRGALTEVTSLQSDIGVYGDDMDDLLAAFSDRFGVSLAGYIWYFHTGEEGFNIGGLFFPPPNERVQEIPITLGILHDFAQCGRWPIEYPEHVTPRSRPDIRINQLLALGMVFALVGFVVLAWGRAR